MFGEDADGIAERMLWDEMKLAGGEPLVSVSSRAPLSPGRCLGGAWLGQSQWGRDGAWSQRVVLGAGEVGAFWFILTVQPTDFAAGRGVMREERGES